MKKRQRGFLNIIIVIIIAIVLAGVGGTFLVSKNLVVQEETPVSGLGTLCSDEKECVSFCLNNRGRCEKYCKGNKNELCAVIFPLQKPIPKTTPKPIIQNNF